MSKRVNKRYSTEFKQEAVRLSQESGKSMAQIGRELGVRPNLIYRWRQDLERLGADAFAGQGRQLGLEAEVT